jgi:hypothetical protein
MIYEQRAPAAALTQGDLLDGCPILFWEYAATAAEARPESASMRVRVVVLTQACDLAQAKATRVLVAVVHRVQHLVEQGVLQSKLIRDQIRTHRVYGWYFLPTDGTVEESIVDLHDLHTIPRALLDNLIKDGKRVASIRTPFREHLAQHFATTYGRVGLPEPYPTEE